MWVVKIYPLTKDKDEQFGPFKAKYEKMSEAKKAAKALIKMAKSSTIAPSDAQTGRASNVFKHFPWRVSDLVFEK